MALGTPVAAATAYSTAGGTSVSPAYPAGILATDVVLLFIGQKPLTANVNGGTVTTPSGWTLRDELLAAGGYGTTIGADTGNTNLRVYSWNTPVAGQTGNLAVTLGQNEMSWAFMVRIPTGGGAPEYGSADGQRTTAPTVNVAFTVNLTNGATATNFQSGDRAIWAMCIPTDVTTPSQFSAQSITATGATFGTATELNEPDSQLGNDIGGYSAWAAVTAGSSTAAPSVTVTAGGTVTNVRGPIVLLRVREGAAPQTLTPNLYTNSQTFYGPTVTNSNTLTPALYTNDQTFYAPDVTQGGSTQDLTPSLYTNDQTFYGPTLTKSNTLTPDLYTNAQTFFNATVSTSVTLTPDLYTNTQTFYNATVSASNALTPALYTNDQTFYSATVGTSSTLFPDLYTNTQTFFAPTVAAGAVTLTPSLYTNDQTFYDATVSQGGVVLQPSLYTNDQTFYAPTVSAGAVNVSPSLYTNDQTFYNATVSAFNQVTPDLYVNQQTFFAADVTTSYGLLPDLYVNTQAFYAPTVASGAITLQPSLYTNTQDFYAAAVTTTNDLTPALFTNTQTFYAATVSQGGTTQEITFEDYVVVDYVEPGYVTWVASFQDGNQFFSPTVQAFAQRGEGWIPQIKRKRRFSEERDEREQLRKIIQQAIDPVTEKEAKVVTVNGEVAVVTESKAIALPVPPRFDAQAVARLAVSVLEAQGIEAQRVRDARARQQARIALELERRRRLIKRRRDEEILLLM